MVVKVEILGVPGNIPMMILCLELTIGYMLPVKLKKIFLKKIIVIGYIFQKSL